MMQPTPPVAFRNPLASCSPSHPFAVTRTDPQEPPPAAAAEYYDHWFATGLEAILLGFQHQLAPR
jgi:hypothetical protein